MSFGPNRRGFPDTLETTAEEDVQWVDQVVFWGDTTTIHSRVELQRAD